MFNEDDMTAQHKKYTSHLSIWPLKFLEGCHILNFLYLQNLWKLILCIHLSQIGRNVGVCPTIIKHFTLFLFVLPIFVLRMEMRNGK